MLRYFVSLRDMFCKSRLKYSEPGFSRPPGRIIRAGFGDDRLLELNHALAVQNVAFGLRQVLAGIPHQSADRPSPIT